jgi:zinc D-Ala-D-Ala carboxypeptidase
MAKYFNIEEFKCKCGCGENRISDKLISMLDDARDIAKTPFAITSGFRCEKHNKAVGGKKKSAHTSGLAVDIGATDSRQRFAIIKSLLAVGFNRIGISKTFIHADIDKAKVSDVAWMY